MPSSLLPLSCSSRRTLTAERCLRTSSTDPMPFGNSMSRKLVLLSVGHIWRREPTRRRVVSWRVGPSRRPGKPALRSNSGAARRSYPLAASRSPTSLIRDAWGPPGDIARDRRELTHCARVFRKRAGSTSRPLRQLTPLRVSGRRRRLGALAGRVSGRAPFGVSPPSGPEKTA
jgi:hypothetical protein